MRKLTIGAVLILAMTIYSMNAVAKKSEDMTPSEETMIICDFLKAYDTTMELYGICEAYCEPPRDGLEDIVVMTEEEARKLDPASLVLFNLFAKKAGVDGPELPCVNYAGSCPVWTQEELERIGTHGKSGLYDYEYVSGDRENYYDREFGGRFHHYAQLLRFGESYVGRYSSSKTGYPNAYREMGLTANEYDGCKQMLINHVTNPNP
ncbi:MAG: hypothetical protein AMK70_01250 [Nitrospira bacterium SG8_35_1]|nr:MAG: hypothetical protein AMK70_01250 [Nitrospira bacterium SG8_35_1]